MSLVSQLVKYFACYHSPHTVFVAVLALSDESLAAGAEGQESPPRSPCVSCVATRVAASAQAEKRGTRPQRCRAQEKRDLVLEGMLRWAVDVHFRRCSGLLQASLSRAVCDGVGQALDAAELSPGGRTLPPCFPLGCRLLLSFVGGLSGDGGAQATAFLQERCGAELRLVIARARRFRPPSTAGRRAAGAAIKSAARMLTRRRRRRPDLPVLDAYVGHVCLCRHLSDPLVGRHLAWLARQALAVLRLLHGQDDVASATNTDPKRPNGGEIAAILASLTHALALLLTRPRRNVGSSSTIAVVPENAGNLLEIVFDSDARPLSGVSVPLAEAAVDVLKAAGHLRLARSEELLRPPTTPARPGGVSRRRGVPACAGHVPPGGDDAAVVRDETAGSVAPGGSAPPFADGIEFCWASVAFKNSWSLAAAGLDTQLPVLRSRKRDRLEGNDGGDDDTDSTGYSGGSDADSEDGDPMAGNGWGWMPDEVTLRVFSFMTPKRVCRLACVDRAWRELLTVSRVWKPFFEARWPVTVIDSEEDLDGVSSRLLLEGQALQGELKSKRGRVKTGVVRWRPLSEVGQMF